MRNFMISVTDEGYKGDHIKLNDVKEEYGTCGVRKDV
jgi:hypothetical protein